MQTAVAGVREEHGVIAVQTTGNFTHRVVEFNAFLSSLREEELQMRGTGAWKRPTSSRLDVVSGTRDDYVRLLTNHSGVVRTVVLPWLAPPTAGAWSSLRDRSNLLVQQYHEWTADHRLCSWIENPGKTRMKYDVVYNRRCSRNIGDTVKPVSMRPLFLNAKPINRDYYWPNDGHAYPPHFYRDTPPYVFHMHIHRDAVVTSLGDVITDGLKLVLYGCSNDVGPHQLPPSLEAVPLYDEVFVIGQFWGAATFHRMVEILPRIALVLDFLKANADVRIVASETGGRLAELLRIVGLDDSRLVAGVTRAKLVYQPRSTACGFANVQESQMLSKLYLDYIRRTFAPQPQNRLVLSSHCCCCCSFSRYAPNGITTLCLLFCRPRLRNDLYCVGWGVNL